MNPDRTDVLARIERAVAAEAGDRDREYGAISRAYRQHSTSDRAAIVDLFLSRIEHYDGGVRRCSADAVADSVAQALSARGKRRLVVPDGFPIVWLPGGYDFVADHALSNQDLDTVEGVVTTCTVAIATTGTLVLTHGDGEGRRALTLVPDYHLCIVNSDAIVETVPEAIRTVARSSPRVMTTISGPSATADIEMTRIKGVHGPRTLDVIVWTDAGA
jgi:L-lactate dehydrogenase complex protein LldG